MANPILETIGRQKDNTAGLLQMAMAIRPAPGRPVRNRAARDERQSLLYGLTRGTVSDPNTAGPADDTKKVSGSDTVRSGNPYGVNEKLWATVSPYIEEYGLSVIEGYRDPKTASSKSAKNSQHYSGNALDINYASLDPAKRRQLVRQLKRAGIGGFGLGNNTLHVDMGPSRYWTYAPDGSWISGLPDLYKGIF